MPGQYLAQRRIAILLAILSNIPGEAVSVAREKRKLVVKWILARADEPTEKFTARWLASARSSLRARGLDLPSTTGDKLGS